MIQSNSVARVAVTLAFLAFGSMAFAGTSSSPAEAATQPTVQAEKEKFIADLVQSQSEQLRAEHALTLKAGVSDGSLKLIKSELERRQNDLQRVGDQYRDGKIEYPKALSEIESLTDWWPAIEAVLGRDEFLKIARARRELREHLAPRSNFRVQNDKFLRAFNRVKPSPLQSKAFSDVFNTCIEDYGLLSESLPKQLDEEARKVLTDGVRKIFLNMQEASRMILTEEQNKEFVKQVDEENRRWSTEK